MTAKDDAQNAQSESRADFMKRWFAVAVSVGFASPLTQMAWIKTGTAPNADEWKQIAFLATALLATVGSWEGYFSAIDDRPLKVIWRFIIDIILVLVYMILLISSGHSDLFLPLIVCIFLLYVIWDGLTIYEYADYYYYDDTNASPKCCIVAATYLRGFITRQNDAPVRRGHIITLLWALYFWSLLAIRLFLTFNNVYVMCGMASLGLLSYRISNATRYDRSGAEKQKTGCTIFGIAVVVVGFLGVAVLLGHLFKV